MSSLEVYVREKEAEAEKVSNTRVYNDFPAKTFDFRTNADVDYSRVLYSSAGRRLQGKMQLFIPKGESGYRNRLTHSHEVAQIAKTIAKKLKLTDTLTVQTCSLAHDLGNPPFGHAGEVFLSGCSSTSIYEGNAQSYRILRWIEERHHGFGGLNLTIRTMLGIVKYFKTHKENKNKFLYTDNYNEVSAWLKEYSIRHKTIDCEIMDVADEVAYAAHDLEDALKLKYFSIDELQYEFSISDEFKTASAPFNMLISKASEFASKAEAYKTSEEYAMLFRKELTSLLVAHFILDIGLNADGEIGLQESKLLCRGLKKLTFEAIKRQSDIIEYEQLGKHILKRLFDMYSDEKFNRNLVLLPGNYRIVDQRERMILDYLGGMTDSFAFQQYEKYFGSLKGKGLYFKQ